MVAISVNVGLDRICIELATFVLSLELPIFRAYEK